MAGDEFGPSIPVGRRAVVPHAFQHLESSSWYAHRRAPPTTDVDELVGIPMHDEGRDLDSPESFGSTAIAINLAAEIPMHRDARRQGACVEQTHDYGD